MTNNYGYQHSTFSSASNDTQSGNNNSNIQNKIVTVKAKSSTHPYPGKGY